MDKNGEVKEDVNIPEAEHLKDIVDKMKSIFEEGKKECLVTVLNCMGTEQVIDVREGQEVWATTIRASTYRKVKQQWEMKKNYKKY